MAQSKPAKRPTIPPTLLSYTVRVRDLIHGFVYLTDLEIRIINHPLFQRLRHIRQNDVAFYVYPSINTSRFEHSLGATTVAGKMAANLTLSPEWSAYQKAIDLKPDDFEQACRLYALLHDVGHLPLSHLFEIAFENYAGRMSPLVSLTSLCSEWFGGNGFAKLHEACGSAIVKTIFNEIKIAASVQKVVLHLMNTKLLALDDPFRPIKLLVDSEIDADRIDFTARDGVLAGGEYGTYDIERLCSAVFLQRYDTGWRLAYSHKALGSIEGLLLDRLRTYTWVHFHHQIVSMKVSARFLIEMILREGIITKDHFPVANSEVMALRDDLWLWTLLREYNPPKNDRAVAAAKNALLYRDKSAVTLLWKNRAEYYECQDALADIAGVRTIEKFARGYEDWLTGQLGAKTLIFWLNFQPVANFVVPLTSEHGDGNFGELLQSSLLAQSLNDVWRGEPQYYIVVLGKRNLDLKTIRKAWVKATAKWVSGEI